jgi:hypothetical protein
MSSADLLAASRPPEESALSDFLRHTTVYERAGAVIPRDLLRFGFVGSLVVIGTGLMALLFPSPQSIKQGDFFLLFGSQAAGLASFLHALAIPAIVCGLGLLALDLYLMRVPTSEHWRLAVVAQAAAGAASGALCTLFLALLGLNAALRIPAITCLVAVGFARWWRSRSGGAASGRGGMPRGERSGAERLPAYVRKRRVSEAQDQERDARAWLSPEPRRRATERTSSAAYSGRQIL